MSVSKHSNKTDYKEKPDGLVAIRIDAKTIWTTFL